MQQLNFIEPGRLEWWEAAAPVLDDAHAALVRPVSVAACDLDAEIVAGRSPFVGPFPIGHEGVAEVIEVGEQVRSVTPGVLSFPFRFRAASAARVMPGTRATA